MLKLVLMRDASEKRFRILRVLAAREAAGEGTPTGRDLARLVGFGSHQGVMYHLGRLEEDGLVRIGEAPSRKVRPITLTEAGWEAVGEMPMLGRIAAGPGFEGIVQEDVYSLVTELASPRSGMRRFVLRASGESMSGVGIEDGDELVIEEQESPPNGSVVATLLLDEGLVTVKRLYREGELVRLKPANLEYEDIVVSGDALRIQGVVVRVLHTPRL